MTAKPDFMKAIERLQEDAKEWIDVTCVDCKEVFGLDTLVENYVCDTCADNRDRKIKKNKSIENWVNITKDRDGIRFSSFVGVGRKHASCTLENYVGIESVQEKIDEWIKSEGFLLIQSNVSGNGKTHLSIGAMKRYIAENSIDKRLSSIFYPSSDLMVDIRRTMNDKSGQTEHEILTLLNTVDLLVIDDIGAEKISEYTLSIFYQVVNRRELDMKPTIITTNLSSQEVIENYGKRILSRIASNVIIPIDGSDNRRKNYDRYIPTQNYYRRDPMDIKMSEYFGKSGNTGVFAIGEEDGIWMPNR